jgi:hypothetical protein
MLAERGRRVLVGASERLSEDEMKEMKIRLLALEQAVLA